MSNMRIVSRRVARLEGMIGHGLIPVWCDDPDDVSATVDAMLARGEIELGDVPRCLFVHWEDADAPAGRHEAALAELDRTL